MVRFIFVIRCYLQYLLSIIAHFLHSADSDTGSESDVDGDLKSADDDEPLAVPLSEST